MEAPIVDGRRKMVHSYNGMLPSYPRIDVHFPFATKMKAPGNYAKQNESGGKKARIGGFHPRILEGNQSREQTEENKNAKWWTQILELRFPEGKSCKAEKLGEETDNN